ncbi:hypothetical protein BDW62DRAFT_88775 [Aspergillus aurantiobrunneus]
MEESNPQVLISPTLRMPFPISNHTASLPSPKYRLNLPFLANNVKLSAHLSNAVAGDLRDALDKCFLAALDALRTLKAMHRERDQRYRRMCPIDENQERYLCHVAAIDRLRLWTRDYKPEFKDLTLASTAKLPREMISLHLSRDAYEQWADDFDEAMAEFVTGEYRYYCSARAEFEGKMDVARGDGTLSAETLDGLWVYWEEAFLPEMKKWVDFLPQMRLPGYDALVDDVFEALLERVEGAEELWDEFRARFPNVCAD